MQRIKVELSDEEFEALANLCDQELRPIPDQVRAVLRDRLRQVGLLPADGNRAQAPPKFEQPAPP